jgi:photosystem II stability/assembly factor-like uncharacterized protein
VVVAILGATSWGTWASTFDRWHPIGPEGGYVESVVVDPLEPTIVFATAYPGTLFKSRDGGTSWVRRTTGLDAYVIDVAIDPVEPRRLYAGAWRGMFKSEDGGASWNPIELFDESSVSKIVIDPLVPSTLFACVDAHPYDILDGLWKSTDAGATWIQVTAAPYCLTDVAVAPTSPRSVYVATDWALHKSTDGGATWAIVQFFSGLYDIAIDPFDPHRLLIADRAALYLVDSDGPPIEVGKGPAFFDPIHPGVVYSNSRQAVLRSEDHGTTWQEIANDPELDVLAVGGSGIVYGRGRDGIARSIDGGRRWTSFSHGLRASWTSLFVVAPASRPAVYAGLQRTRDDGRRWKRIMRDVEGVVSIVGLASDPSDASVLYAATGEGPDLCCSVGKSLDFGETWRFVGVPGASAGVDHGIAIDPRDPNIVYVGVSQEDRGGVARSNDGGRTWRDFYDPSGFRVIAWLVDPVHAGRVYVGTAGGVFVSEDFAETWTRSSDGLPKEHGVTALAIHPRDAEVLYAGTSAWYGYDTRGGVYRSDDAGRSWQLRGLEDESVGAIVVDPSSPLRLYAGTSDGVFASDDESLTWRRMSDGLDAAYVWNLSLVSGRLYAASENGLYRLGAPETPPTQAAPLCRHDLQNRAAHLHRKAVRALRRCLDLVDERGGPDAAPVCAQLLDVAHDGTLLASSRGRASGRLARRCAGVDVYDLRGLTEPVPTTVTEGIDYILDESLRRAVTDSGPDACEVLGTIGLGRVCEIP